MNHASQLGYGNLLDLPESGLHLKAERCNLVSKTYQQKQHTTELHKRKSEENCLGRQSSSSLWAYPTQSKADLRSTLKVVLGLSKAKEASPTQNPKGSNAWLHLSRQGSNRHDWIC